jgi:hypothetical protein
MTQEALKLALKALDNNRRTHRYCEDTWYSCPKHEDGCANDSEGDECNCGADEANIEIDAAITSLRQAIAEWESQEPVVCRFCRDERGCWAWQCDNCGEIDDSQEVPPSQRTWVDLTEEDRLDIWKKNSTIDSVINATAAKLKEKNT